MCLVTLVARSQTVSTLRSLGMGLASCNFIGEILDRATYVVRRNWAVILIKRKEKFLMMCVEEGESYRA